MVGSTAVGVHILIGSVAIAAWWTAFAVRKGSDRHRAAGKLHFLTLALVVLSVGAILATGRVMAPALVIQFLYLALCLVGVSWIGWRAIRLKSDPSGFRSPGFRRLAIALVASGSLVLLAGVIDQRPLTALFSVIGLGYGLGMLAFLGCTGPLHPRWWLGWHLNAVCGLFNAVHGTLLALLWERAMGDSGDTANLAFQLLTVAGALMLRQEMGRRWNVPWGFGPAGSTARVG
jgi:hypothetical protein